MRKVLVLEDEANIRSFVVINLKRAGYDTLEASSGEEAMEIVKRNPDIRVALLDVMLPGIDGFEVCRRIRADNAKIGIIMLTARTQEMDKVTGLMTGADDYVTKPFSPAELTARVDALYRRTGGEPLLENGVIRQDPFLLNTRNRTMEKNGQRIKLTQVEYSIIKLFMDNPGKAHRRASHRPVAASENAIAAPMMAVVFRSLFTASLYHNLRTGGRVSPVRRCVFPATARKAARRTPARPGRRGRTRRGPCARRCG